MRAFRNVPRGPNNLTSRQRLLLVKFLVGITSLVLVFTGVYYWGMATLEGRPRSSFQALNTVIETLTTTGFGAGSDRAIREFERREG